MKEIKLIIEVRKGIVELIRSNVPLQYVIVDYDQLNAGHFPLSVPLEPDAIGNPLHTMYDSSDAQQAEISEELRRINF